MTSGMNPSLSKRSEGLRGIMPDGLPYEMGRLRRGTKQTFTIPIRRTSPVRVGSLIEVGIGA